MGNDLGGEHNDRDGFIRGLDYRIYANFKDGNASIDDALNTFLNEVRIILDDLDKINSLSNSANIEFIAKMYGDRIISLLKNYTNQEIELYDRETILNDGKKHFYNSKKITIVSKNGKQFVIYCENGGIILTLGDDLGECEVRKNYKNINEKDFNKIINLVKYFRLPSIIRYFHADIIYILKILIYILKFLEKIKK